MTRDMEKEESGQQHKNRYQKVREETLRDSTIKQQSGIEFILQN